MVGEANGLVQACAHAAREGAAFSDIWKGILKGHGLVAGSPIRMFDDSDTPHIDVRLHNGFFLRYSALSNDFSLRRAAARRGF